MATATDSTEKRDYLSMVDIFQDLSSGEMDHLERVTSMVTCERGRVFFNPEEAVEVLFILKRGEVALSRVTLDGRKIIVATVGPGSIFGEMAIVGQRLAGASAEALTDCLICVMSRVDVEELLLKDPRVSIRLVEALGRRLAAAEERIEEMAFKGVPARLAALLLRLATDRDWRGRPAINGLTHEQLAMLIGSYRETVTATLNQFRSAGLIEIGRRKITILDAVGLAARV
jgi:CRP/FNR family cyclic AMP-dependent transcriptional regulator